MPTPFPGMDPYLEKPAHWSNFHSSFITYWRDALFELLPDQYEANLGERVYLVENDPEARKLIYPDLAVTESPAAPRSVAPPGVATLEPVTVPLTILEGPRETYIEIVHRPDQQLVTVLELLSPANKEPPGRIEYLAKRRALLYQQVHLVELDLLRGGRRMPTAAPLPAGDYYYLVARAEQRLDAQVFAWSVRQPLPRLPVPLRAPDHDIVFDLAAVFATTYERARFGRAIDYHDALPTFWSQEDRDWAKAVLGGR